MPQFNTMHLFNAPSGGDRRIVDHFNGDLAPAASKLRGFSQAQLFHCSSEQLTPEARQPWQYAALYEFATDTPEFDIPALAPLLANARDAGVYATDGAERIYTYQMYAPWKFSGNYEAKPFTHLMFLLANCLPGHEVEYHQWYEDVHSVEVSNSPGYVGMRRGQLSEVQVPPVRFCPGDQLILGAIQTEDLRGTLDEFLDRAYGRSQSGVNWGERSSAASLARTVHIFESVAEPFEADGRPRPE